jgi:broad specificity phosphatase PhoE
VRRAFLITHPNVVIDPALPVPQWPLSDLGKERMRACLRQPWVSELSAVYSSAERKAMDAAEILADHLGLPYSVVDQLGENDRSVTGFVPPQEFERMADAFFGYPEQSIKGWETAANAQQRIVGAVERILTADVTPGSIALVSHGAVGTLLYCHLLSVPISRLHDQPANGGGNYYSFEMPRGLPQHHWRAIDALAT